MAKPTLNEKQNPGMRYFFEDLVCRRSGMDRRRFSYTVHIPERRSGQDRRIIDGYTYKAWNRLKPINNIPSKPLQRDEEPLRVSHT